MNNFCVAIYNKVYEVKYFEVIDTNFNDIYNIIKECSMVFNKEDIELYLIKEFVQKLSEHKNWYEYDQSVFYPYFIKLFIDNGIITIKAYHRKTEMAGYELYITKQIIVNRHINGNCIDDFIQRGVEPLLNSVTDLKNAIKDRCKQRINVTEYHNTACYESDFIQISLIKELIEKLLSNCNRQLEAMSDKYTKL